jgi:malate dehydrogenase (oxaloacetate-decarboxylating)(NADP+)
LSLAYTPGVAVPCLEIKRDPEAAYKYTSKGNLVAVVTNGSAVLGLGDIGGLAGKPVMEGKAVLFKRFADIDVYDLEIDSHDPEDIIRTVQLLEPTFGGINLEDIRAPECFYIEERLKELMDIPVFHDDQHGTAIISGAALINALDIVGKDPKHVKVVYNGAGAAGIACADLHVLLGVQPENMIMCDSKGVLYVGREDGMNPYKAKYQRETDQRALADALRGADVFIGVSAKDVVTGEMAASMAENPIIFAMANPDPEITPEAVLAVRQDAIMATGRSDYPNQVNNVLGFPFVFRGALDVRARAITDEMKIAAAMGLAELAREDVPEAVSRAYGNEEFRFGRNYIIPKPFDSRVLTSVAPAVARAAIESGVARVEIDLEEYPAILETRLGHSPEIMRSVINKSIGDPRRIVLPEGAEPKILRAARIILDQGIGQPVLLGVRKLIVNVAREHEIELDGLEIVDPTDSSNGELYSETLYWMRQRKGITREVANELIATPMYFGAMMVRSGDADCLLAGVTQNYPDTIRPALQVVGVREEGTVVAGLHMVVVRGKTLFFADTTVNIDPSAEVLAEIALLAAGTVRRFDVVPHVAMLSYSNFGSVRHESSDRVRKAAQLVKDRAPDLELDGEMHADTALVVEFLERHSFSTLNHTANTLIFPNLDAGNIAYKLMEQVGGAQVIGPILMGAAKSVHVLARGCSVDHIVNMAAITVVDAQMRPKTDHRLSENTA